MNTICCKIKDTRLCYYLINKKYNITFYYSDDSRLYDKIISNHLDDNMYFKYVYFYFDKNNIMDFGLGRKNEYFKTSFKDFFKDFFRNEKLKKRTGSTLIWRILMEIFKIGGDFNEFPIMKTHNYIEGDFIIISNRMWLF